MPSPIFTKSPPFEPVAIANVSNPSFADGSGAMLSVDTSGRLRTVVSGAGSGGTSATDDSAFVIGVDAGTPLMALADEVAPDSVDEGDVGVARMSLNRILYTIIRDAAGNERGANVNANSRLEIAIAEDNVGIGGNPAPTSPIVDVLTSTDLAAGSSTDLDGTTISAASTGKVDSVVVGSSVMCKWELKTRDGAVEVSKAIFYTNQGDSFQFNTPHKNYVQLAGNGVDENFRVTVTNLDDNLAADVHATIIWDEV